MKKHLQRKEKSMMDEIKDPLKENYYALLIAIAARKSVSQSLSLMGIPVDIEITKKKEKDYE